MAKTKNKKRNLAETVHAKKLSLNSKKLNPFEVHINKEKMQVLGRKLKNDRGLPGVSRAKAIKKRKDTLLQEYKLQHKSNKFTDRRIGEKNRDMSQEEKLMARFTAIRKKAHSKKSIFNLADDEVLTHRGQTLSEIEKFDDPRSDDDDDSLDDQKHGNLDSNFVEDAHFGGGILRNTGKEGAMTHKDLIEQLIAESKKRKAEKQKLKEATLELTEKLDTEWKDLMPLVNNSTKNEDVVTEKQKVDDYDKVMRELKFEARGTVSDRLKTEDEIAKEEKERLEELERERLERMKGFSSDNDKKMNHRSADDLDDDFVYESDNDDDNHILSYNNEGKSNLEIDAEINGKKIGDNSEDSGEDSDDNNVDSEDPETESEDDLSDLKNDDISNDEEEEQDAEAPKIQPKIEDDTCINEELKRRKDIMEKARQELPFTYQMPENYEKLLELLSNQSSDHQFIIIERIIKCNHPSLGENNKNLLSTLFAYLLQYINDLATNSVDVRSIHKAFDVFNTIAPQIFELAHLNPENAHYSIKEVIKEKHEEFRKNFKNFPGLEILLFLKLVSLLFSTSDFKHQVVTPCFIFIEQILNKCRIKGKKDVAYGLFVATLFLEFTALSKRYLPAVINFLGGLLHMAVPKLGVKLIKVKPPFKATSNHLVLINDFSEKSVDLKMNISDLLGEEFDDDFKIRCLYSTLKLIEEFDNNYAGFPSNVEIFDDIFVYLNLLPDCKYPEVVRNQMKNLIEQLEKRKSDRKLSYLQIEAKRPKALRLYEPKIEEVFDGKKRKYQSKEKAERDKLLHKLKKEKKGALREIRRDKAFLGRVKIKNQLQSDKERRDKVQRIFSEAAIQQSELNTLDRKKKKK